MKFTQIPSDTFKSLQMNAGILVTDFDPLTGTVSGILGATSGGNNFNASPSFIDFGEDIDNCPKNTMELKRIDDWDVKMTGTFVTVTAGLAKKLTAAADIDAEDETHIIPRRDLLTTDFESIWFIGDYSDVNTGDNAGYLAIHVMNALSTTGFQIQSGDKAKGQFAYEYTGHYSISKPETVPFEIYVKTGQSEPIIPTGIGVAPSEATLAIGGKIKLETMLVPKGATGEVTFTSSDDTVATVDENGEVTGVANGSATITTTCGDFEDSCTVTVGTP